MTDPFDLLLAQGQRDQLNLLSKVPPTLSLQDGVAILSFEAISLSTFEAGKKIPAKYRWEGKNLRFIPNAGAVAYVKRTWTNVILLKDAMPRREAAIIQPVAEAKRWTYRKQPFEHQARALELGAPQAEFAYLMDMGTGKTKVAIDDAAFHFARGEIDRVLVIAPNGVHEQWIDDALPQHWPLELACRRAAIITGEDKPDWWGKWDAFPNDCKWLAVNIENINVEEVINRNRTRTWTLTDLSADLDQFIRAGKCMVIIDEAHKIKSPDARRTVACWKLGRGAAYRRILTGTPIAIGLEDYYAQFRFLNINIIGCDTMAGFKKQFCVMGGFDNKQVEGYRNTEEFHARIGPMSYRVEKADVLDLPPKMFMERLVDLTPQQRRVYNELRDELITELSDGSTITTNLAVQKMLRLQQVTQGFLPLEEEGRYEEIKDNRLPALLDMTSQASGRVIIWCRFTRDVERIAEALGEEYCVKYYGKNKGGERAAYKEAWTAPRSRLNYFVGNAEAGGTGLDWINGAQTVIYYSNSFSSLARWQSEDRTHRIGTVGTVSYYDIICRGTIDRAILRNLKRKRDVSDMSLTEIKEMLGGA